MEEEPIEFTKSIARQLAVMGAKLRGELESYPALAEQNGWVRRKNLDGSPSAWVHGGLEGIDPLAVIGPDVVINHGYPNQAARRSITIGPHVFVGGHTHIGPNTHLHDDAQLIDAYVRGLLQTRDATGIPAIVRGGEVIAAWFCRSTATRARVLGEAKVDYSELAEGAEVFSAEAFSAKLDSYAALRGGAQAHSVIVRPGIIVDLPGKIEGIEIVDRSYSSPEAREEMDRRDPAEQELIFRQLKPAAGDPFSEYDRGYLKRMRIALDENFIRADRLLPAPKEDDLSSFQENC